MVTTGYRRREQRAALLRKKRDTRAYEDDIIERNKVKLKFDTTAKAYSQY